VNYKQIASGVVEKTDQGQKRLKLIVFLYETIMTNAAEDSYLLEEIGIDIAEMFASIAAGEKFKIRMNSPLEALIEAGNIDSFQPLFSECIEIMPETNSFEKLGPLQEKDELIITESYCVSCGMQFSLGEFYTLIPVGPGTDAEARRRARAGRKFQSVTIPAHWACVTGIEDDTQKTT
jgi:hypothetical protein